MTGENEDRDEACQKEKTVELTPGQIVCECTEIVNIGETCSCGIKHEREVKDSEDCEDPWTGYERGEKKD